MRDYVIINGVNSLTIKGLAISKLPPITKPMIRTQREEIDGRDGDLITELGYSAYDKELEIGLYGNFEINDIIKYFTGEGTIVFSNENDKYYYFKIIEQIDYEALLKFKTATVTLHCQPFKYPLEEEPIEIAPTILEDEGETISFDDTYEGSLKIIDLKGNTYQDSTTGTNYFNASAIANTNIVVSNQGQTITMPIVSSGNGVTSTGKKLSELCPTLKVGDEVVLWFTRNLTQNVNNLIYLEGVGQTWYTGSRKTITQEMLNSNVSMYGNRYNDGETAQCIITDFRLVKNYNDTWEKFTYGASPNPDYPQPIHTVSGDNTIEVVGKNLLDTQTNTRQGYISSTGVFTQNIYYIISDYIKVEPSEEYTLSYKEQIGVMAISEYDSTKTFIQRQQATNKQTQTFTLASNTKYVIVGFSNGSTVQITPEVWLSYKPMLEKGNQATTYQPYQSQNYPINLGEYELCKIGDYQDKFIRTSGKNLFDEQYEFGTIDSAGQLIGSNTIIRTKNYQKIEPSTQYSIKVPNEITGVIFYYYNNGTFVSLYQPSSIPTNKTLTFTSVSGANQVKWRFNSNYTTLENQTMLVKGTTATEYEPYGEGDWYLKKEIGKVVLDGGESWILDNASVVQFHLNYTGMTANQIYSNNFRYKLSYEATGKPYLRPRANQLYLDLGTGILSETTVSALQNWLSTHNTTVYYVLSTPTYTKITGELKEQLEALEGARSYDGQTNIWQENDDLAFFLNALISYLEPMEINNIGNIYAKPILTIEGSGNIEVVLNDIQILEIDLGDGGKIAIDVPNLEAFNPDDNTLLNRYVTGDYMKLLIQEGENTLSFNGDVSKATLTNYIRYI